MCVSNGITAAEVAMARTLQTTNAGSPGTAAARKKLNAPTARIRAAARLVGQPAEVTSETTMGETNRPRLPEPATMALDNAPAAKYLTAIVSRNVLPAVSRIPALAARHNSWK